MLIPVRALFRAVLVAAIFFSGTAVAERSFSSRVISCIDGDTVKIQTRQHIRFAGIDTPEKASDTSPAQYYAREARQLTRQLVLNKRIKFVPLPGTGKDRYGRLVVEAFLPDGDSLNERLLREGAAYFYDHRDLPESMRTRFLAAPVCRHHATIRFLETNTGKPGCTETLHREQEKPAVLFHSLLPNSPYCTAKLRLVSRSGGGLPAGIRASAFLLHLAGA